MSALFETESGYDRCDFCLACWRQRTDDRTPFSLWQGAFAAPAEGPVRVDPVERETAETLLRRLMALEDPTHANVIYILAVMLERKRQLIERDTRPHESGGLLRIYEHRPSGDTFVVLDPQLRLEAIDEVQRQVIAMLGGVASGGEAGASADPAAPAVSGGRAAFDVIIRGGTVVDGTGQPARLADVAVRDGRIAVIGALDPRATAACCIDAAKRLVTPGFIDVHSHSDAYLLVEPDAPGKIRQGITTEIVGQCGCSAAPVLGEARHPSDWQAVLSRTERAVDQEGGFFWRSVAAYRGRLADRKHAPNVVALVGHNTLRAGVMGYAGRAATSEETRAIVQRLEQALDEGASGFSTGLIYTPGRFSQPDEILALARAAAAKDACYATHMRSEGDRIEAALDEVLQLVRETGIRTEISHLKTAGRANWPKLDAVLDTIRQARQAGMPVHADRYPYCVSATSLDSRLPGWAQGGGNEAILGRLGDPVTARRLADELDEQTPPAGWEETRIGGTANPALTRFRGATVGDVAREWQCRPAEALLQILRMDKLQTEAFFSSMSDDNLRRIYAEPWVMVGSDASIRAVQGPLSLDHPHPRTYATCIRFLRRALAGDWGFGLEEAVRRLTDLPASAFRLAGRGRIAVGAWADLVVLDASALEEGSSFDTPHRYPAGVCCTLVNGQVAFDGTQHRERPGRWLVVGRPDT
ncbi:MAG: amidohydrolase family protein [Rhodospirillales bacterium]|nr:amidohydrolase family protein [Rhodospirillales bacterium]